MSLREAHTAEAANLAAVSDRKQYTFDKALLESRETGNFWSLLDELGMSLAVSREYEHFILLLSAPRGTPRQSPLPLPHPSGIAYDAKRRELIVSSTRTPNIIFWLKLLSADDLARDILPTGFAPPDGSLFMPYRSSLLPGSLYIHEITVMRDTLYATVTGHNFLARLDRAGGWRRAWNPRVMDAAGPDGFRVNSLQLNGVANGGTPETSYYTSFSDSIAGAKPWKSGYGPKGKGVLFSGASRDVTLSGLTCPHSPRLKDGEVWLCNSGFGEVGRCGKAFDAVMALPGFTRGLAFFRHHVFVGLSKVIESYEPYAPGVPAKMSQCAVYAIDLRDGKIVGAVEWPNGYQIFDVQVIPGVRDAILPFDPSRHDGELNSFLRYLG